MQILVAYVGKTVPVYFHANRNSVNVSTYFRIVDKFWKFMSELVG